MRYFKAVVALILIFALSAETVLAAGKYINMTLEYDGGAHNYSAEEVTLVVDGKTLSDLPMPPIIFNDYTLVPAREVFEALGAEVDWISDLYQVYVKYEDDVVMLQIDSTKAYVNGEAMEMSIAPKIINDKTMIPLRFASESIGMEVGWNSQTRVASVSKPAVTTTTTTTTTTTEATTETTTAAVNIVKSGSSANMSGYMSAEYDTVTVNSLTKASDSDSIFLAGADGEISSVTVTKLSAGKVAVDINNATNGLPSSLYNVSDNKVESIEVSGTAGTTRLLFNMKSEGDFRLYLSSDRKTLGISVGTNSITSITMEKLVGGDKLTITGTTTPSVRTTTSVTGDLLTVDVTDAVLDIDNGSFDEGRIVSGGTYYQFNANTVRISIDLQDTAGYTTDTTGNSISLTIAKGIETVQPSAPTASTLSYDAQKGLVLPGAAGIIDVSNIVHSDNYNQLNYVLTLKGDFSSLFTSNTFTVNDGNITTVEVTVASNQAVVKFNESRIMAMDVTVSGSDILIKPVLPKQKYSKIIVLDAGHGGTDVGTTYGDLYEKDITLAILNKTKALFDASDIKCYATRTTDVYPSFDDRTNLANEGDAFVSIHINSAGTNTTASGTETYSLYPNNLGNGLTSYILAEKVLNNLLNNLGTVNRKVKSSDFKVLRDSDVPATLAEIGFITNAGDRAIISSEDGQNKAARAIYDAVVELFNEYTPVR